MIFNPTRFNQALALAGSLSLFGREALALPQNPAAADNPEGQAGIATLCIEKRSHLDLKTGLIVTPRIYIDEMPKEGIDTLYFEGSPAEAKWKELLKPSDPKKKAWIEETNIPEQAYDAFDLMKKLDKDKNGIVTYEEFENGEKGVSAEGKKNDLSFLTSLRCSGLYLTEVAPNRVDPTQFPAYIDLHTRLTAEIKTAENAHAQTSADLETERARAKRFQTATYGLGGLGLLLGVGLVVALRRGRKTEDKKAMPPKPVQAEPPAVIATPAPAKSAVNYEDVLTHLPDQEKPSDNVLEALKESDDQPAQEASAPAAAEEKEELKEQQV